MKNGNNLGLVLGTNVKFYISVVKGLKLKVKKFLGLILTFVEVTGENLVGGTFAPPPPSWIGLSLFNSTQYVDFYHLLLSRCVLS